MKVDRRNFLKSLSIIGVSGIIGNYENAFASEDFRGYPARLGMLTDLTLCVGCRYCEKACKEVHNLPPHKKPLEDESKAKHRWHSITLFTALIGTFAAYHLRSAFNQIERVSFFSVVSFSLFLLQQFSNFSVALKIP